LEDLEKRPALEGGKRVVRITLSIDEDLWLDFSIIVMKEIRAQSKESRRRGPYKTICKGQEGALWATHCWLIGRYENEDLKTEPKTNWNDVECKL